MNVESLDKKYFLNDSEARNEWSEIIDNVVRERPQFVKREHDNIFITNFNLMEEILGFFQFTANKYIEEDDSVTLSLNEIELVENGWSEKEAKMKLAEEILEYSLDYYENFHSWSMAPNRRQHIPYILKALILRDINKIGKNIKIQTKEI